VNPWVVALITIMAINTILYLSLLLTEDREDSEDEWLK
jgi:hypothetical protein